jgi:type III pantothenate kinase
VRSLLLTVDIGNSSTSFALFDISKPLKAPVATWSTPTPHVKSLFFRPALNRWLNNRRIAPDKLNGVAVSSVVPAVDKPLRRSLNSLNIPKILFISSHVTSQVQNLYQKPSEVGADRLVNARAAMSMYPGASIVVDFGTATTFDCVAKGGKYLGGVIAPGPVISAEALYTRTAKLPHVILKKPARILGRNTKEAIESGLYHGYRGLVMEIATRLKERMGSSTQVIATGGQARWLLKGLKIIDHYEPHLTHIGLVHYWKDQIDFKAIR